MPAGRWVQVQMRSREPITQALISPLEPRALKRWCSLQPRLTTPSPSLLMGRGNGRWIGETNEPWAEAPVGEEREGDPDSSGVLGME